MKAAGGQAAPMRCVLVWGVHLFTASGAIFGLLAVLAMTRANWKMAFVWMGCTLVIDGVDGKLARLVKVSEVLPGFDGALLDNVVDYFTYVIVPAVYLCLSPTLAESWRVPAAGLVCLASAYQFSQTAAKTADHFFTGFPSYWNIVVFYLAILALGTVWNLAIIVFLCGLVFVPVKFIYPSRTRRLQRLTLALTVFWALDLVGLLIQYPKPNRVMLLGSAVYVVYYVAASAGLGWVRARGG